MPPLAFALALAAAFVHAAWNLLLGRAKDSEAATSAAMLVGVAVFAPVALVTGHVAAAAWPFLVVSNLLELGYIALLARAYNEGRASAVYPVARGSAPVLVLVASVAIGRVVDLAQLVGVVFVAGGVVLLRATAGGLSRRGLALGLSVGACIAGYTLVDKSGLEHASPLPYLELAMSGPAVGYFLLVGAQVRSGIGPAGVQLVDGGCRRRPVRRLRLVLLALARAAAAPVAAVRETSVVILTIMSAVWLHEHIGRRQWLAAVIIAGGIATLAFG